MSAAREFVRKETMGYDQKVTVEESYTRTTEGPNRGNQKNNVAEAVKRTEQTRVYANIYVNKPNGGSSINLGVELCRAGLAGALQYAIKENDRSSNYCDLVAATKEATDEK